MACRYYDDILVAKILKWLPENTNLRVLGPSESKKLFEFQSNGFEINIEFFIFVWI